jgi:hypothetical protein
VCGEPHLHGVSQPMPLGTAKVEAGMGLVDQAAYVKFPGMGRETRLGLCARGAHARAHLVRGGRSARARLAPRRAPHKSLSPARRWGSPRRSDMAGARTCRSETPLWCTKSSARRRP